MGTLHVGLASDYPPDADTQRRIAEADAIVLEDDVSQSQRNEVALATMAMLDASEPGLDQRLGAPLKGDCEGLLTRFGLSPQVAWRMKPWLLAMELAILQTTQLGYLPQYATEAYLAQQAQELHKPILEIEGIEAQLAMLDAQPWPEQVDFLRESVQAIRSGEAESDLKTVVAAWRGSDAAAMQAYLERVRHGRDPAETRWFERMVTQRNAGMASSIDRLLQDGRVYLIAVGSLHYFGDDGLVELLKRRGYEIKPL